MTNPVNVRRHNGVTIRTIREVRRLDRGDLAMAVDIAYPSLANIENEHRDTSPEILARIARALDVPVSALLRDAGDDVVARQHNGGAIKALRIIRGLDRAALAAKVGVAYPTFANWENEHKGVPPEALHRLADVLDVPVAAILRAPLMADMAVPA